MKNKTEKQEKQMNISKEELYKLPKDILVELLCKTYDLNNLSQESLTNSIKNLDIAKILCIRDIANDTIEKLYSTYKDTRNTLNRSFEYFIVNPNNEIIKQDFSNILNLLRFDPDKCIDSILKDGKTKYTIWGNLDHKRLPKKWLKGMYYDTDCRFYPELISGGFLVFYSGFVRYVAAYEVGDVVL